MSRGRKLRDANRAPDRPGKELRPIDPNQAVLDLLAKGRADLTKERPVTFWFYFPNRKGAESAGKKLAELGYSVECVKSAGSNKWLCLAAKDVVPQIGKLVSIQRSMERIAEEFGGMYDGWETELSPEEGRGLPGGS